METTTTADAIPGARLTMLDGQDMALPRRCSRHC